MEYNFFVVKKMRCVIKSNVGGWMDWALSMLMRFFSFYGDVIEVNVRDVNSHIVDFYEYG